MGIIELEVIEKQSDIVELDVVEKYNPYHDKRGRFTSAGGAASFSIGGSGKGQQTAIANEKKKHDAEIKAVASAKIAEATKAEPGITKNLTGIAAKKSTAECCLINMVDKQIITTANTTNPFHAGCTTFSFVQTEAMPRE